MVQKEVVTEPAQKEGVISLMDTAQSLGSVKAKQLPGKVALSCDSPCWYITNKLHPKKARPRYMLILLSAKHWTVRRRVQCRGTLLREWVG